MLSLYNAYTLTILFLYILFATLVMSSNKFSCILYEQTMYGKLKQGSRGINPYSSTSTTMNSTCLQSSLVLSKLRNIRASSRLSNCLTSSALNVPIFFNHVLFHIFMYLEVNKCELVKKIYNGKLKKRKYIPITGAYAPVIGTYTLRMMIFVTAPTCDLRYGIAFCISSSKDSYSRDHCQTL